MSEKEKRKKIEVSSCWIKNGKTCERVQKQRRRIEMRKKKLTSCVCDDAVITVFVASILDAVEISDLHFDVSSDFHEIDSMTRWMTRQKKWTVNQTEDMNLLTSDDQLNNDDEDQEEKKKKRSSLLTEEIQW